MTSCCWWRNSSRNLRTCTWACTRCTGWQGSCCARRWRRMTRRYRRWSCLDGCGYLDKVIQRDVVLPSFSLNTPSPPPPPSAGGGAELSLRRPEQMHSNIFNFQPDLFFDIWIFKTPKILNMCRAFAIMTLDNICYDLVTRARAGRALHLGACLHTRAPA